MKAKPLHDRAARPVAASDLIAALRDRWPRLATTLAAGQMALPAAQDAYAQLRERRTYTVKMYGTDDLYDDLHEWVLGLLPPVQQRALVAWTSRQHVAHPVALDEEPPAPSLRLRYDGSREQAITIGRHKIRVMVTDSHGDPEDRRWRPPEITFTASSPAGRDALLAEIRRVQARSHGRDRKPVTRMLDRWGDWVQLDDLLPRTLESVVLPEGQMDRIVADVGRWLDAEAEYGRRYIPWHRAHLYEGDPGTGKTSVARAVASHYGMDVWYLPLGDMRRDGELLREINRIGPRSLLLLEDVDVFHAATDRDDDAPEKATLSGLLNALDGIATPHGLLTILTSNKPGVLDDALLRAGRVDLVEHFGPADAPQVAGLLSRWYGQDITVPAAAWGVFPAEVIEACKRHDDPAAAIAALLDARSFDIGAPQPAGR